MQKRNNHSVTVDHIVVCVYSDLYKLSRVANLGYLCSLCKLLDAQI